MQAIPLTDPLPTPPPGTIGRRLHTHGILISMTSTTIKVPAELRERVQQHAKHDHVSQAAVIEHALDLLDQEAFFNQLRRDVAENPEDASERSARETWLGGPVVTDGAAE